MLMGRFAKFAYDNQEYDKKQDTTDWDIGTD